MFLYLLLHCGELLLHQFCNPNEHVLHFLFKCFVILLHSDFYFFPHQFCRTISPLRFSFTAT